MADDETVSFRGRVRPWDPAKGGGLAVVDVPADLLDRLGGRRQARVSGTINDAPYAGSGMLVAGGGYCIGVSKAALKAARADVGDEVEVAIARA